jgi:Flp pilus assembly protein TadD
MLAAAVCGACSRSRNPVVERVAFLPFENLTGDAALDWISSAGPTIVNDELLGGAAHVVPVQVGAVRDAYASGATQLVHGYVEKRRQGDHFEFVIEDAQTHKTLQTWASDGDPLPSLDRLAKQIDPGAHAFSSTNPQAVAAWASGDYEKAVSLDPTFGAAWSSWVRARAAAAGDQQDKPKAIEIAARALAQPSLQSPVDRAQLEFLSATLHQDEPGQERALTALAQLTPHDLTLLRQLATREMNARRFTASARYYQAILQDAPDDIDDWNLLGYAQAFAGDLDSARKSFRTYGGDPAHAANALDSEGEASFLNGKFTEAEKLFLAAHAKSSALLNGADLLKAAYSRWLQGDLPGADKVFLQYIAFRTAQKDPLILWRQAVWEYSTGRTGAAIARLANVTGPAANLATAQLALWKDPSKLPHDLAALKQAYERTQPAADGIPRVFYAAALAEAGQKDEAKKLIALWPLPGLENDPLIQSFVFPKYLGLKRELK